MTTEEMKNNEMEMIDNPEQIQSFPSNIGRLYKQFSKSRVYGTNDKCSLNDLLPLFHPFGPCRYFWDIFTMVLLLYTCIEAPVSLAFGIDLSLNTGFGLIALFVDISLLIDVIINFRTAYFDNLDALKLIIDPKLISSRYLKSWFIIDIVTCIPFQLFDNEEALGFEFLFLLRLFKTLRIIKILRFLKMVHVFDSLTKHFGREIKAFLKLSKVIFFMLLFAHFAACCWWFVGEHTYHETSWIDKIKEDVTNDFDAYSYAWYWAVVTLFTTGYGDIVATNTTEQWVSSVCIIIGTIFFSYFIGTLTVLITDGDKDRAYEHAKLEEAQSFCEIKKLPKELTRAILTHISYHCQYNYVFNEHDLMQSLPPYLQTDIHKYLSHQILTQIDIFNHMNKSALGQLALKMRSISCNEDYELFKVGDRAKEIYIQRTGVSTMRFCDQRNNNMIQLKRGHIFGEYSLVSSKRKVSVECNTWSEFYILKVNDILNILKHEYPATWLNKWEKIKNIVVNNNYVKNKSFKIRKVKYKINPKTFSDHNLHHYNLVPMPDLKVDTENDKIDESMDENILVLNNTLSAFLQGASTVKTARFHGRKSIQTEWDGSIPSKLNNVDIKTAENQKKSIQTENDHKMQSGMSVINERNTLHEDTKLLSTDLLELQSSQSESQPHLSVKVGIFEKAFKKNSSIRHSTMSSVHRKKMPSLTLVDLQGDQNQVELFSPNAYKKDLFYGPDDDGGDVGSGLQDIESKKQHVSKLIDNLDATHSKSINTSIQSQQENQKLDERKGNWNTKKHSEIRHKLQNQIELNQMETARNVAE